MWTLEPKILSIIWARSLTSPKHIFFWCQFLDLHLTTYRSNVGVHTIVVFNLGTYYTFYVQVRNMLFAWIQQGTLWPILHYQGWELEETSLLIGRDPPTHGCSLKSTLHLNFNLRAWTLNCACTTLDGPLMDAMLNKFQKA